MNKQLGESEWQRMSELERQKKMMELKLKERQLRREGKFDEISQILGIPLCFESILNYMYMYCFYCYQFIIIDQLKISLALKQEHLIYTIYMKRNTM